MSLSNISIKSRLLVLCLVPAVVIIGFAVSSVIRIQEELHSYAVIDEKARTLNLLSVLSGHIYQGVNKRLQGQPSQTSVSLANETIKQIELTAHQEVHSHHSGDHVPQTMEHLEEIKELLPELNSASPQSTVEIARLVYEVLYDVYFDIQKIESHNANLKIHKLDLVLSDLSWLYYWMEREAWLARELNVLGWQFSDFAPEYFRIYERQQFYLDKYITESASSSQVKDLLALFSSRDFRRGNYLREQILSNRATPEELITIGNAVEKRNQLVLTQLTRFSDALRNEIDRTIQSNQQNMLIVTAASLLLFAAMFAWGTSTLLRINNKLARILATMRSMRNSKDSADQIQIEGNDEFTVFAGELNHIIEELYRYQKQLVESKETAEAANKAKSIFLANMSHEIRTPLNGIVGMTEILSDSHLNQSQKEVLSDIDASSHALLVLINDILDLSKIESGKLTISEQETDIRDCVYETLGMLSAKAFKQQVELQVELDGALPERVKIDSFRFKQVLMNLVSNAIKFTKDGFVSTEVTFHRSDSENKIRCAVIDSGVGIEKSKLHDIFKPFTQEDGSITRRYGGTGLGLTICKQIVEVMGGEISVESTRGLGSCFEFTVPVTVLQSPSDERFSSLSALVVENESKYSKLLKTELERYGVAVTPCSSVHDALLHEDKFDLVMYSRCKEHSAHKQLPQLSARFSSADIIILQHHLYLTPDLDAMVSNSLTMPILGLKLESILKKAAGPSAVKGIVSANGYLLPDNHTVLRKVLIVEDNLMNQKIASFFLNKAGIEYKIASNGQEAVDMIALGEAYSAILMDCMMPVMDGLTATRKIRQWEYEQGKERMPIIALTASVLQEEIDSCFEAGMDAYLPKPYKSQQLFDMFERLNVPV